MKASSSFISYSCTAFIAAILSRGGNDSYGSGCGGSLVQLRNNAIFCLNNDSFGRTMLITFDANHVPSKPVYFVFSFSSSSIESLLSAFKSLSIPSVTAYPHYLKMSPVMFKVMLPVEYIASIIF